MWKMDWRKDRLEEARDLRKYFDGRKHGLKEEWTTGPGGIDYRKDGKKIASPDERLWSVEIMLNYRKDGFLEKEWTTGRHGKDEILKE